MDFLSQFLLPVLIALIPTGGVVAIFTVREKKTEMMLNNAAKVNEAWQKVAEKETQRADALMADCERKDAKIDAQYARIEELHKEKSELMAKLDEANTEKALAKTFICDKIACLKRRPPYGQGLDYDFHTPIRALLPQMAAGQGTEQDE